MRSGSSGGPSPTRPGTIASPRTLASMHAPSSGWAPALRLRRFALVREPAVESGVVVLTLPPIVNGLSRRSLVASAAIATLIAGPGIGAQQPPRFGERVDVARIIIDARVLDDAGNPVPGLTPEDFKVKI